MALQQADFAAPSFRPAMLMPETPSFAVNPAPQTTLVWAAVAGPSMSVQVAPEGYSAAQLPVVVIAQLASVVPTRVHVAVVAVPEPIHFAVQVEPTVMAQLVSQLALATLTRGTPMQRTASQAVQQRSAMSMLSGGLT
jgi:hypothetical protein